MKFKEHDTVRIMKDCGEGIKKGTIGAILMAFEEPQEAYEVEMLDEKGNPKAQRTFLPDDLELAASSSLIAHYPETARLL